LNLAVPRSQCEVDQPCIVGNADKPFFAAE